MFAVAGGTRGGGPVEGLRGRFGVSRPECRYLDDLPAETDVGQAESAADQDRVPKQAPDLLGPSRGGDVKIFGAQAQ